MNVTAVRTTLATPIGPVTAAVSAAGLLTVAFGDRLDGVEAADGDGDERAARVADQLGEYFAGGRTEFTVPIDWSLSQSWRREVLRTLFETVPYGSTVSYGELARRAGRPGAAQVVGGIMASNPIPIVVPCHRVVDSNGGIGGFTGSRRGPGIETKRRLLVLEGSAAPTLFD